MRRRQQRKFDSSLNLPKTYYNLLCTMAGASAFVICTSLSLRSVESIFDSELVDGQHEKDTLMGMLLGLAVFYGQNLYACNAPVLVGFIKTPENYVNIKTILGAYIAPIALFEAVSYCDMNPSKELRILSSSVLTCSLLKSGEHQSDIGWSRS